MLITQDQLDKILIELNESYARHERMIDELSKKVEALEKKKPGRPPKDGD